MNAIQRQSASTVKIEKIRKSEEKISYSYGEKTVKEKNPNYMWDAEHLVEMADITKLQCCFWKMWTIDPNIGEEGWLFSFPQA